MISIGVFENEDFTFSKELLRLTDCALITNPQSARLDIALVSGSLYKKPYFSEAKLLIIPDSLDRDIIPAFSSKNIISYGLCRKNTITASSLIASRLAISLQRKIEDICGNTIEEQEFIMSLHEGENAEEMLGLVSTLLAIGNSPEVISKMEISL